jgi:thymidylate kinase
MTAWARLYKEELHDPQIAGAAIRILSGQDAPLEVKLPELAVMRRLRIARLHLPDAVVMLDVDPAVSMARIRKRGEKVQAHETEEKLARLREGYLMVCEVVGREFAIPVRVLEGDLDLDSLTATTLEFVAGIGKAEASDEH